MINVIYEDKYILVVHKPAGLATQTAKVSEKDLVSEVSNYLRKKNADKSKEPFVGIINRLDQPVEGLVLLGLDSKTTAELSAQLASGNIQKRYYAAFAGEAPLPEGVIADFLLKDDKSNTSMIVDAGTPGAKKAVLEFKEIGRKDNVGLADIHLITGRHHQIRVQMAGAGMPLLGDRKYAPDTVQELSAELGVNKVALCSYSLSFNHPVSGEEVTYKTIPRGMWFNIFEEE